jgi:transposase-like protein
MERLNEEVRRREHVIRIFPNRESAVRLLGAVLMEQHEQWATGHRYFDMALYWQWRRTQESLSGQAFVQQQTLQHAVADVPLRTG